MRFAGIATYPLFIAPYDLPTNLTDHFAGGTFFDKASVHPIIQTALTSDGNGDFFWNAIVPKPFDYGQTYIHQLAAPSGGVLPFYHFDPIIGPGSYTGSFRDGNGVTGVLASGKIFGCGQPQSGGFTSGIINVDPPNTLIDSIPTNGITDTDFNGPFYWNPQNTLSGVGITYSPLGPADIYNAFNANYSLFWAAGQSPLMLAQWADIMSSIGLPFGSSSEAIYWPGSHFYPTGRFYPWQINALPGGGLEPGGGGALPIDIEFDGHPELNALTADSNNFQAHVEALIFIGPGGYIPGQNFTPIVVDTRNWRYYFIRFVPRTPKASLAITDMSNGQPSIAQDELGIWYLVSTSTSLRQKVFHTQGLVLDYYPVTLEPPPPFVLPCFNPCQSFIAPAWAKTF